jgi:uncharacterized membrane protein YheB (UPF0754 family)
MTMEEMNVLRIFERKNVRKIHGPLKGEHWRVTTNKEIKDILHGEDTAKFIKSLQDSMIMSKECKTRLWQNILQQLQWTGQRKDDPHKIWRDEVEEDLSIMGVQTGGQWPGTVNQEWRKIVSGSQGPH